MTRERYVKLLMSKGVSRNDAFWYAANCRDACIPYAVSYCRRYGLEDSVRQLSDAFGALTQTTKLVAGAFKKLWEDYAAFIEMERYTGD